MTPLRQVNERYNINHFELTLHISHVHFALVFDTYMLAKHSGERGYPDPLILFERIAGLVESRFVCHCHSVLKVLALWVSAGM